MPRGDRTGPTGDGPRSGRGAGDCTESEKSGQSNPGRGRRLGLGFWRKRGSGDGGVRGRRGQRGARWLPWWHRDAGPEEENAARRDIGK